MNGPQGLAVSMAPVEFENTRALSFSEEGVVCQVSVNLAVDVPNHHHPAINVDVQGSNTRLALRELFNQLTRNYSPFPIRFHLHPLSRKKAWIWIRVAP